MIVVIDTNALKGDDWSLNTTWLNTLIANADLLDIKVCIPKVVMEEAIRQFKNEIEGLQADLGPKAKKYSQMTQGPKINQFTPEAVRRAVEDHRNRVYGLFDDDRTLILSVPSVNHETLIDQYVAGRRPFKSEGTGYKDALIWYSLLEVAAENEDEEVVLVTNNATDFARSNNHKNEVHPELSDIAKECGVDPNRLSIEPNLYACAQKYVTPRLQEAALSLKAAIVEGRRFDLNGEFQYTATAGLEERQSTENYGEWISMFDDSVYHWMDFVGDLVVAPIDDITVAKSKDHKVVVSATIEFTASFETETSLYSDIADLLEGGWDIDNRTVSGTVSARFTAKASLEWDDLSREVVSRSLDELELQEVVLPAAADVSDFYE